MPLFERFNEALQISKLAAQQGCSIISSFLLKSNRVAILTKIIFAPNLRIVINVHEHMSQHLVYAHPSPVERLLHGWIARLIFRKADLIVAVSKGVKSDLISNFGAPPEKIVVVYNPIDLGLIRRKAAEPLEMELWGESDGGLVVAVGRLVKLKGFDLLIQAFARLSSDIATRLIIIGDGEERQRLQQLVERLGLDGKVLLIGPRENPWKYMARADVFALPSLTEAFPNVVGEALALEKPVLATDCSPGVREYLQDGECGLLVAPGDEKALADGLRRLLTDRALRERLAKRAYERVAAFDVASTVRNYEKALAKVLNKHEEIRTISSRRPIRRL